MGGHKRKSKVGSEQDFKVSKIILHPSYHKPKRYSHDIALLKLERPAVLNRFELILIHAIVITIYALCNARFG